MGKKKDRKKAKEDQKALKSSIKEKAKKAKKIAANAGDIAMDTMPAASKKADTATDSVVQSVQTVQKEMADQTPPGYHIVN